MNQTNQQVNPLITKWWNKKLPEQEISEVEVFKEKSDRKTVRYNWPMLKLEFMRGPWETVNEFLRFKKMTPRTKSPYISAMTRGWPTEKRKLMSNALERASSDIVNDKMEEIKSVKLRQARIAKEMIDVGHEALVVHKPETAEEARKMIQTGMEQEREALGIGVKGGAQNLTQVNFNLPKTKFDQIIDGNDFEGILGLIAEIRRERIRRTGELSLVESKDKTE